MCFPPSFSCPMKWGVCGWCCWEFPPVGHHGSDTGRPLPVPKSSLLTLTRVSAPVLLYFPALGARLTQARNSGTPSPSPRDGPLQSARDLPTTHREPEAHSPATPPGPPKKGENRAEASMILPRGTLSGTSQAEFPSATLSPTVSSGHASHRTPP